MSKATVLDDVYLHNICYNFSDPRQKTCILLLDEVYVKATLQYHANVMLVKTVKKPTLFGGPTSLCKMLPVKELDAKFLIKQASLIICSSG